MRALALVAVLFSLLVPGAARAQAPSAAPPAPATDAPADAALATRGQQLMLAKGCFSCHSTDGTARSGPTLKGLWGQRRPVLRAEGGLSVRADDAYIARAIRDPDYEVVVAYPKGLMPRYDISDDDARAVAEAIRHPEAIDQGAARRGGTIAPLIGCCAAFVLLHFLLSSIPVRRQVQAAMGAKGFGAVYSILAFASFGGMIVYARTAPLIELWTPPHWTRWVPVLVMPLALLGMVTGFSTPSPTAVGQEGRLKEARPIGITAVTRHPGLWGFALWALSHLATNGELHVELVAASIFVLAIGGMLHIDARRKAAAGADWDAYAAQTSVVPFVAIAQGRARLVPSEIGIRRVAIAAILYVVIFFAHPYVIGASPSP
ncbi:MAG: NnrU family protein [Labilithrix sp.]